MAVEEMNKVIGKRNELAEQIKEKKNQFDNEEVEVREQILADVEGLEKEIREMDNQIKELEATKETFEEQEQRMSLMNNVSTEKVEERKAVEVKSNNIADSRDYKEALEHFYKTGEKRAILTTQANVPIPTVMQREIEVAWKEYGDLVNLCDVVSIRGILAVTLELTATGAVWHAEGEERPTEESITFGQILLNPMFIKKWISLSDEVILLTGDDFLRYIAREMTYRILLELNSAIINRTDANNKGVIGIVGNTYATAVTALLDFNTPNVALAQLRTWRNIHVAMNPATFFNNVLGLTDLQGMPIYKVMQDNEGRPRYYYAGLPVVFTDALPAYDATSNAVYMVVGNFDGYKLNLPYGRTPDLLRDVITSAREDMEIFVGKLPAAGNVTKQGYFATVKAVA